MRRQIQKLMKGHSTKAERKFMEMLKEQHIPFIAKAKVAGREIDFLVGKYAIEIDGHEQDGGKNELLAKHGWIPVHYNNSEIDNITYEFN
ncbi:MAG: hypothetical protein CO099_10195 [Bdellovibrio sp. CG_4_9_14_3_um_filter_39_7]|nr:MAG: hypothetical protein CO099_10195 [Bdellovibrio sp. CG_4_9_14_3_um_filter_39_7]